MSTENKNIDEKITDYLNKINPTGEAARKNNLFLGTCVATMASQFINSGVLWNRITRFPSHLLGAFAIPAGGAFLSSAAMHGIEGIANLGINAYNKRHPEKEIKPFEIDPKAKKVIKFISTAAVGLGYAYATSLTELDQFRASGEFQWEQYMADWGGVMAGTAVFHELDIKDTIASFSNKIWKLGNALGKPIDKAIEKVKNKNKETITHETSNIEVRDNDAGKTELIKDKGETAVPVWDLSLYENNPESITMSEISKEYEHHENNSLKTAFEQNSNELKSNDGADRQLSK